MAKRYWIYSDEDRNDSDCVGEAGHFESLGKADAIVAALEAETGDEYYRTVYRDDKEDPDTDRRGRIGTTPHSTGF